MKKIICTLLLACATLAMTAPAHAQCGASNTAFKGGETLIYNLYFNWKFVWVKVGTASFTTNDAIVAGKQGYRSHLITRTNAKADKFFVMRDTLTALIGRDLSPVRYTKHAQEGKNYYREEVLYTYPQGKSFLNMRYSRNYSDWKDNTYESAQCAFDMVSMLQRARSFDPTTWKVGHRVRFTMAGGKRCEPESIVYRGKETFKMDGTQTKYRCLVFSFMEPQENGKEKEIIRFFITDDKNHLPVRLDMNLNFGTAKAYLTMASGIRNPQDAKLK